MRQTFQRTGFCCIPLLLTNLQCFQWLWYVACIHLIKKLHRVVFLKGVIFLPPSGFTQITDSGMDMLIVALLTFDVLMQLVIPCRFYLQAATVHSTFPDLFPTDHCLLSHHCQPDRLLPWPCSVDDCGAPKQLCCCCCRGCRGSGEQSPLKGQCWPWFGRSIRTEPAWRSDALMRML